MPDNTDSQSKTFFKSARECDVKVAKIALQAKSLPGPPSAKQVAAMVAFAFAATQCKTHFP